MSRPDFRKLAMMCMENPDNKKCFDCDSPNPTWSSCKLGIYICLNCAGKHRGYGVGISFVRAADLDRWTEDQAGFVLAGGNKKFEQFLRQYKVPKPVNYIKTEVQEVLEEYRQELTKLSKQPEIKQIINQFKIDNGIEEQQPKQDSEMQGISSKQFNEQQSREQDNKSHSSIKNTDEPSSKQKKQRVCIEDDYLQRLKSQDKPVMQIVSTDEQENNESSNSYASIQKQVPSSEVNTTDAFSIKTDTDLKNSQSKQNDENIEEIKQPQLESIEIPQQQLTQEAKDLILKLKKNNQKNPKNKLKVQKIE